MHSHMYIHIYICIHIYTYMHLIVWENINHTAKTSNISISRIAGIEMQLSSGIHMTFSRFTHKDTRKRTCDDHTGLTHIS